MTTPEAAAPAVKIQAWETEEPTIVVWGTHDPGTAADAANEWYRQNIGDPVEEELLLTPEDFAGDDLKHWGRPDCPEHETWTADMFGRVPVEGFVPYLALDRN
jgi:hypothetical protein